CGCVDGCAHTLGDRPIALGFWLWTRLRRGNGLRFLHLPVRGPRAHCLEFQGSNFAGRMILRTALLALVSTSLGVRAADADLILHHGSVVTIDQKFSVHEAVAVRDGRIVAVGSDAGMMKFKGAN